MATNNTSRKAFVLCLLLTAILIGSVWAGGLWRYDADSHRQDNAQTADLGDSPDVAGEEKAIPEALQTAYAHGLWYDSLTKRGHRIYDELLVGFSEFEESVEISRCTEHDVSEACAAVCGDHPELFWVDVTCEYEYIEEDGGVTVFPRYLMGQQERDLAQREIDSVIDECLSQVRQVDSEYEQVRYCYEWIIQNTDYHFEEGTDIASESIRDQLITSVFIDGQSVCAGYARAFQYLLRDLGIDCVYVDGFVEDEGHAWNLVFIDENPVLVDVTWGDPTLEESDGTATAGSELEYDYFCVTDEEMGRSHTLARPKAVPLCDTQEYDYYRRAGLFLDQFDKDGLGNLIANAVAGGETTLRFKLGTKEAYDAALSFIENDECWELLPEEVEEYEWDYVESMYIIEIGW